MEGASIPQLKKIEAPVSRVEVRDGKKNSFEKLSEVMGRMAQEVNSMMKEKHGLNKFVDAKTGCVRIDRYGKKQSGGIYDDGMVLADLKKVDELDREFSGADNERVQQHFSTQYNIPATAEAVVEQFRKNKEADKSGQTEMAITALLHKILKDRFVVVRASTYDDYHNEMDNLILDSETGAVICAFDEVLLNEGDDPNNSKKLKKITDIALAGGKKAKYGLALEGDKIVRSGLMNVPVFYLELQSSDLNRLAGDLLENFDKKPTALEQKLFTHLVASIERQKKILEGIPELPFATQNKLKAFEGSLQVLSGYGKRK